MGQNRPNWNHLTISSRKVFDSVSPKRKPPMSLFHHGIPHIAIESPLEMLCLRAKKLDMMSPFQTHAPTRWLPV